MTTTAFRGPTLRGIDPVTARIWTFAATLAVAATLLTELAVPGHAYLAGVYIPWPLLGLGFFVALVTSLEYEIRRQSQAEQMWALPLVVGLFLVPPAGLIGAAVLGSLLNNVLRLRLPPIKTAFNAAQTAAATATALAVFDALAPTPATVGLAVWPAAFGAAVAYHLVSTSAVLAVIGLAQGAPPWRLTLSLQRFSMITVVVGTSLALLATAAIRYQPATGWTLPVIGATVALAVRGYHRQAVRHRALNQLYRFTRGLGPIAQDTDDLSPALQEARELLHAEELELALLDPGARRLTRVVVSEHAVTTDVQLEDVELAEPAARAMRTGSSLLHERGRGAHGRQRAASPAHDDMLVVPVGAPGRSLGVLQARQRSGDVRGFDAQDLVLLEAVAGQLTTALEKGELVEGLRRAATRDSLTGLANLDAVRAYVTGLVQPDVAGATGGAVVLFMDVDRFQDVNETLGHDAGDRLLIDVGARIRAAAPEGSVPARVGSDKFVLALPGTASSDVARLAAMAIKSRIDGSVRLADLSADVRVTIGIARAPDHGHDAGALLRRAEMAMTAAKGSASAISEWEPGLERGGPRRLALVSGLRRALSDGALEVVYQPKLELGSGRVSGFEALVRWSHPELGPVPPSEFVPLAEACGLVGALTTNVLRLALAECRRWQEEGKAVGVAVNLSARSLSDPALVGQVAALLTASGLSPEWLTLEITESSVMDNPERAVEVLHSLRRLGVRLSIDDFGTGYSSLTYVKGLPVDEVKVDKSFIDAIHRDEADRAVVRAVVELARTLNLSTVAEGVEEPEQALVLADLGLEQVQGYFYARPMRPEDARDWLRTRPTADCL